MVKGSRGSSQSRPQVPYLNEVGCGVWQRYKASEYRGSDENDGLVAKESQFYPKTFYNPATKQTSVVHLNVLSEK